jgi:hypothetical protein
MFRTVGSGVLWGRGPSAPLTPNGGGLGSARRLAGNATAGKLRFGLALTVTAVGSREVAIVAAAPAVAESVFIALVGARGFVDAVPEVAGSLKRLREEMLGRGRLSRGTRLVERAALPELAPGTTVGVVPSVFDLFDMFAPVVVEFVVADELDDGAGDDGVATNKGGESDDCPEIG